VPPNRIAPLDGLRGLAAFSVVLYHVYFAQPSYLRFFPTFLMNGSTAVYVFFVLSGFVLAIPYWSGRALGWVPFIGKRLLRIYPVLIASLVLAVVCAEISPNQNLWIPRHDLASVVYDLLLIGMPVNADLNGPIWTLVVEIKVGLLFPAMMWLRLRTGFLLLTLAVIVLVIEPTITAGMRTPALSQLLHAMWSFVNGIELARIYAAGEMRRFSRSVSIASIPLMVLLLAFEAGATGNLLADMMLCLFVPGLVVWIVICSPIIGRALTAKGPVFLGVISYSLYLVHMPLILLAKNAGYLDSLVGQVGTIAACILMGCAVYVAIERPAMALCRTAPFRVAMRA
jgi:peptidoglycan/LPS O-acetylase OafA/YrhL